MIKLLTIIGARPQIIKASAISRAIRDQYKDRIQEVIVHTGQHYDRQMSEVFFEELQIPKPDYNLQVGSGPHGVQTAKMITGIEEILVAEQPDYLIIYGDTNSTLAGAIAASKTSVPIVHIEAGLRSYNKKMPEEINRIVSDHTATYLFPPTQTGVANLVKEGFRTDNSPPYTIDNPAVFNVGDIMYDNSLYFSSIAAEKTAILEQLQLTPGSFVLATVHRNANTDDADRLNAIFQALQTLSVTHSVDVVLPLHPRTVKQIEALLAPDLQEAIRANQRMRLIPPASFLEMTQLEQQARLIITDSGGVQKEAYFYKKPCIILRAETEWVEIVEQGAARLCDADAQQILEAYDQFDTTAPVVFKPVYGDGDAATEIINILVSNYHK
ncbi:non-hydrolyzing UDP-N-acetylglucosamine 2-epimerase [Spirosoma panaciterrae]|uniref:non-hydrolyzing UDP-N-acetylglucosamine 2-epimerase n=1 Tax=Spirosoma panaciterrae TaxID=496058 RepID=UPI000382A636|nr:UDP-N-acetylglucosamine 2-epimerase (non-hydrolyzing) [Spirosoma panaciterrae]